MADQAKRDECQVCGRNQALKDGRLFRHGYQRPGWGWLVGGCMGAGHLPFPDTTALEQFVVQIEKRIAMLTEAVAHGTTTTVAIGRGHYVGRNYVQPTFTIDSEEEFKALIQAQPHPQQYSCWTYQGSLEGTKRRQRMEIAQLTETLAWARRRIEEGQARQKGGI